jgi:hypothetical protein
LVQDCTNCHKDKTVALDMQFLKCIDCHMPCAVASDDHKCATVFMMLRHHPENMKIVFPEWPCIATVFMMLRHHP